MNWWTHCNWGLYAVKRLLYDLCKRDLVDKDLCYRYTDKPLREMDIVSDQNAFILTSILRTLMEDFGVTAETR